MNKFNIGSSIWVDKKQKTFLGKGRIELLKLIDKTGSLSKAAKEMKMSYKAAWDTLNDMNKVSGTPLIESSTGGKGGGGSKLTAMAHLYIALYEKIYDEQRAFFDSIEPHMSDYDALSQFLNRTNLRVSARNQIKMSISSIKQDGLNTNLKLKNSDIELTASITTKSVNELGLKKGVDVYTIIKSSAITIVKNEKNDINTNILEVNIKDIENNHNISEYIMQIGDTTFVAIFSTLDKNLNKGDKINISIQYNNIMIGV